MASKDFAFLFYVNDWAGGTQWMTRLQRGAYIDLLLYQVNNTCFSLEEVKTILGSDFDATWPFINRKFDIDNGNYYNKKMRETLSKRASFTQSRRENRLGKVKKEEDINTIIKENTSKTLVKQVGNENENVITNGSVSIVTSNVSKIENWLKDLENSSHIEDIARVNGIPIQFLKSKIPSFKKKVDLDYPNHGKFITHFKNYCVGIYNKTETAPTSKKTKEIK